MYNFIFFIKVLNFKIYIFFHLLDEDGNDGKCKNVTRIGRISRRKCKEAIARAHNEAEFLIGGVHSWKVLQNGNQNMPDVSLR